MPEKKSKITATVDFAADGKQHGYLNIPHSRDESAWGSIQMPISIVKNGNGPTVLFTGANHGDEYEGPIALVNLRASLEASQINGRVIIIPALNFPAFRAGKRTSPVDGGNMNRVFPGRRDGTITEMIAHYVTTEILPLCDAVVDIHAGGKSMYLSPCSVIHDLADKELMARTLAAMEAFAAPIGLVLVELDAAGMFDTVVEDAGKVFVSTELGGGGTASRETIAIAETGVRNILCHFGVLDEAPVERSGGTRLMHTPGEAYLPARASGLYEILAEVGQEVAAGDPIGRIHFIDDAEREPLVHVAPKAGTVILRHVPGLIEKGDCMALIGEDYKK
jgi:N-alpha-acetyl-L-2,4-diaminobutyrate deacetylase